ncbi:g6226 [Coccomyxa viridis]|uniref:G6226 protein n=1 Tax=Coccomyxa viridis TaxID=1274662 RepID=A0ABP1FW68_9CHLO
MTEEATELEKVPLSKGTTKSEHDSHQSSLPEIVVLDEDSRPSTSGKSVPAINWGDRKVSPDDLEALKTRIACEPPWRTACSLVSTYFQRSLLEDFYRRQNDIIDSLMEVDTLHSGEYIGDEVDEAEERRARRAVALSFLSNIVLLMVRVSIAAVSGSLSIIVTTLDAVLDVISGFIIWSTSLARQRRNKYRFPIGQARMEPLGIIVFSCIMGTAGFSVILEAVRQLLNHTKTLLPYEGIVVGGTVGVIVMKVGMWLMCRKSNNPSVQAFALDHINDVVVNTVGLFGALLGDKVASWLDPLVAMLLSVWLIYAWGGQAYYNVMNLVGLSATPQFLQKLTYLCWNHDPRILQIDTVRAYTFGDSYLAEVDIVLPASMSVAESHDIAEELQIKLERLPDIARAFVHIDYETSHEPEHKIH